MEDHEVQRNEYTISRLQRDEDDEDLSEDNLDNAPLNPEN
jgi:hypothetical protein